MKIAERTAAWRRERRVLLRVSRAAWRLEQADTGTPGIPRVQPNWGIFGMN